MHEPTTFAEFVEWYTERVDDLERRVVALALALGRADLATPIPRPPEGSRAL